MVHSVNMLLAHGTPLGHNIYMQRYSVRLIESVRELRSQGKTYSEIKNMIKVSVPKSTLSEWCSSIALPLEYTEKITELNKTNLHKGRAVALVVNRIKREKLFAEIKASNTSISLKIHDRNTAKIALAMLCLGEATKSSGAATSLCLGNSDHRIIMLFLNLLKLCFDSFSIEKVRCTVQCRADQDILSLEKYWRDTTGIPKRLFYSSRIDPRTIGKPTKKKNYKGVLRVDYFDNRVWLELESLADLVYNQIILKYGPVA